MTSLGKCWVLLTLGLPGAFNNQAVLAGSSGQASMMRAVFCLSNSISISCGTPSPPLLLFFFILIFKIPFLSPQPSSTSWLFIRSVSHPEVDECFRQTHRLVLSSVALPHLNV